MSFSSQIWLSAAQKIACTLLVIFCSNQNKQTLSHQFEFQDILWTSLIIMTIPVTEFLVPEDTKLARLAIIPIQKISKNLLRHFISGQKSIEFLHPWFPWTWNSIIGINNFLYVFLPLDRRNTKLLMSLN